MRELCRLLVKKSTWRSSGTFALDAGCGKTSRHMAEAAGWPSTCFRHQKTGETGREGDTDRNTHTQSKEKLFDKRILLKYQIISYYLVFLLLNYIGQSRTL